MQQRNARTASSSTTEHTWSERAAAYVCSSYPELTKATRAPQKLTPPPPASKSGVSAGERCEVYGKGHYTCSTADIRAEQHSVQLIIITARDTNGSSADRRTQDGRHRPDGLHARRPLLARTHAAPPSNELLQIFIISGGCSSTRRRAASVLLGRYRGLEPEKGCGRGSCARWGLAQGQHGTARATGKSSRLDA